ncbi:hypothetical protein AGDE_03775 [Angomonas deanei]|uniref:Uncharacterized protein n=1 Tax=Angomonas deanei TaxID=59799 RepID=A0A7G2CEX6_9TRYP|nr:hypothetical protein AGDE_03775 [Angomonas deanei]CAD2217424.1 hypothetical protein, conserved [Angomonas deanei]|eukprot:EPY40153.1 hypothetical protein AGDE_03775 [Angomonas deanei]
MENKAPGTEPRPQGYSSTANAQGNENFFVPKQKVQQQNIQRAGLRSAKMVGFWVTVGTMIFILGPTYIGPFYVNYIAEAEWMKRVQKSIWTRRNEGNFDLYMTQRKNTWSEWLGLKQYDISSDENPGEIQKYR